MSEHSELGTLPSSGSDLSTRFGFRQVTPEEKTRLVRGHFDRISPYYDSMNTVLSLGLHLVWKRRAVEMLQLRPGERVLDLCGGTGDLALHAAAAVGPTGQAVVFDVNRKMMMAGRPKARRLPAGCRLSWVQSDAERIAAPDGVFDAAMVGFGIRNVTHWADGLGEMARVLRPGGRFLCLEFSQPVTPWFRRLYDLYSFRIMPLVSRLLVANRDGYAYLSESIRLFPDPESLRRVLEEIGFTAVRYRRFTNGIAVGHVGTKA